MPVHNAPGKLKAAGRDGQHCFRAVILSYGLPSNFDGLMERKNGKFLSTSATNYYLAEMINGAADRLILISPFLKSRSVISMKAAALSRVLTCMNLAR